MINGRFGGVFCHFQSTIYSQYHTGTDGPSGWFFGFRCLCLEPDRALNEEPADYQAEEWGQAMYKKILIPLDGSDLAESILPYAIELASNFGSHLILLSVVELSHLAAMQECAEYDAVPQPTNREMERRSVEVTRYLGRQVEKLDALGIDAHAYTRYGPVVSTILCTSRDEQADLIAMASHGRGGLSDVYYGSVAAGVLQRIDRPLLIVRAQETLDSAPRDLATIEPALTP